MRGWTEKKRKRKIWQTPDNVSIPGENLDDAEITFKSTKGTGSGKRAFIPKSMERLLVSKEEKDDEITIKVHGTSQIHVEEEQDEEQQPVSGMGRGKAREMTEEEMQQNMEDEDNDNGRVTQEQTSTQEPNVPEHVLQRPTMPRLPAFIPRTQQHDATATIDVPASSTAITLQRQTQQHHPNEPTGVVSSSTARIDRPVIPSSLQTRRYSAPPSTHDKTPEEIYQAEVCRLMDKALKEHGEELKRLENLRCEEDKKAGAVIYLNHKQQSDQLKTLRKNEDAELREKLQQDREEYKDNMFKQLDEEMNADIEATKQRMLADVEEERQRLVKSMNDELQQELERKKEDIKKWERGERKRMAEARNAFDESKRAEMKSKRLDDDARERVALSRVRALDDNTERQKLDEWRAIHYEDVTAAKEILQYEKKKPGSNVNVQQRNVQQTNVKPRNDPPTNVKPVTSLQLMKESIEQKKTQQQVKVGVGEERKEEKETVEVTISPHAFVEEYRNLQNAGLTDDDLRTYVSSKSASVQQQMQTIMANEQRRLQEQKLFTRSNYSNLSEMPSDIKQQLQDPNFIQEQEAMLQIARSKEKQEDIPTETRKRKVETTQPPPKKRFIEQYDEETLNTIGTILQKIKPQQEEQSQQTGQQQQFLANLLQQLVSRHNGQSQTEQQKQPQPSGQIPPAKQQMPTPGIPEPTSVSHSVEGNYMYWPFVLIFF